MLSLVFLAFSCSDDDDAASVNNSNLIGIWDVVSRSIDGELSDLDECNLNDTITFTTDEVYETEFYINPGNDDACEDDNDSDPEKYTLEDDNTIIIGEWPPKSYSISGSTLTITSGECFLNLVCFILNPIRALEASFQSPYGV